MMNYDQYDKIIFAFSGGKDSIASFLHLLRNGAQREKMELWHQNVDGKGETFFDWEVTPAYCRAFAEAFNVPIYFSWKEGGFLKEMSREDAPTAQNFTETPSGEVLALPRRQTKGTRRRFPQVSPNLSVRWCSAYLKIDVFSSAIRNQERFNGKKTLVVTGERAEESLSKANFAKYIDGQLDDKKAKGRARYKSFEPHRADKRQSKTKNRHIDHYRPIKDWPESQVWKIIQEYKVTVHPCYYLGWSRCSCKFCIFGNADQYTSAAMISPNKAQKIAEKENEYGCKIKRDGRSIQQYMAEGTPYQGIQNKKLVEVATSTTYDLPIFTENWKLPLGAYGESCGPM